jgi:NAD(P)H-hydrate epimerase
VDEQLLTAAGIQSGAGLPTALYRTAQIAALEQRAAVEANLDSDQLMARAGMAIWNLLRIRWPHARRLFVLAGAGNNGGDGYVVARLAHQAGWIVQVWALVAPNQLQGAAATAASQFQSAGGSWHIYQPGLPWPEASDIVLDALLGTGLQREITGIWAQIIQRLQQITVPVIAVDVPSGLHADSGAILGHAVAATATITFIGLKRGLCTGFGPDVTGDLYYSDLGLPQHLFKRETVAAWRQIWQPPWPAPRQRSAHKGLFGHVLVIGGGPGMAGAARLCGEAALRVGAGLVTIAAPRDQLPWITLGRPELMTAAVECVADLETLLTRVTVIAIGPGLGQSTWAQRIWNRVQTFTGSLVVDADALNLLAQQPTTKAHWVLTPHPGEAARLLNTTTALVLANRFTAAQELQRRYGGWVVLKGAGTLIQAPEGAPWVCAAGNPGLATAGMGDVLTGVIAGLLAQGLAPEQAARAGVCLHATAADHAVAHDGERGLLASDVLAQLRATLNQPQVLTQ